jgi:Gas vesicle synthesis protein GvpO
MPWGGAPAVVASPPVAAHPPAYAGQLTMAQVIDSASRAIVMLNRRLSAITSVAPGDDGWRVMVELVERRGVPDTNDLLGVYELRLDPHGNVMRYERIRLRRRGDLQ